MKNQYVGDIGDYGKYGLLRFLANNGIRIGINWYLTENDNSSDGKFVDYLRKPADCNPDISLFTALQDIASCKEKTVQMVKEAGLVPCASYYEEVLHSMNLKTSERDSNRRNWFDKSTHMFHETELVFADPDNGISFLKTARNKYSEKYVLPEEIVEYYNSGKNVVYYCHKGRRKPLAWERYKTEIRKYVPDAKILIVTYHRGTQRSYVFVVHPDSFQRYEEILSCFLNSTWGSMFTREGIRY